MTVQLETAPILGEVITRASLDLAARDRMFALMTAYYENVHRGTFERDLEEKDYVVTLCEPSNRRIVGFSSLMLRHISVNGRDCRIAFSGDTIVDAECRGSTAMPRAMLPFIFRQLALEPETPLYWALICKGWRTYRYLPVFLHSYDPAPGRPVDLERKAILDAFLSTKYGAAYDAIAGIVRNDGTHDRLKCGGADVPAERARQRDIAFFIRRNPGWVNGDELACIGRIDRENLTPAAQRFLDAD